MSSGDVAPAIVKLLGEAGFEVGVEGDIADPMHQQIHATHPDGMQVVVELRQGEP